MHSVDSCILFAKKLSTSKITTYLVPYIQKYADDKSWRLRYLIAEKIIDLYHAFGPEIAMDKIIPHYVNFLTDTESEVRTVAV